MRQIAAALLSGALFGLGLTVSRMIDPAKVLAFLDVAGHWDPSLALVLAGAAGTAALGFHFVFARSTPFFASGFKVPAARGVDVRLIGGAALFGVGWGLVGLCPGPALVGLDFAFRGVGVFVLAMLAGMALFRVLAAEPR